MPAPTQPIQMTCKAYERSLDALFKLYKVNKCIISIIPKGSRINTRVQIDELAADEMVKKNELSPIEFSNAIKLFTSAVVAVLKDEVDKFTSWINNKKVYIIDDIDKVIDSTKSFLNKSPGLADSFLFRLNTISTTLLSVEHQLYFVMSKDKKDMMPACKLLLTYSPNSNQDSDEKTVELDMCLADIDYLLNVLNNIKTEIQEMDKDV